MSDSCTTWFLFLPHCYKCDFKKFFSLRKSMSLGKIWENVRVHYKCRNGAYPRSGVSRFPVPDDKVSWEVEWTDYEPVHFSATEIEKKPWADPDFRDPRFRPLWNSLDGGVDRKSHGGPYKVVDGLPLNPWGRTGMVGRGILGRWGPNHAADPVITRWKRDASGRVEHHESSGKPMLQFVGIERKDCKEWAFPGGMVDPGETISATLKREFLEEAMDYLQSNEQQKNEKAKFVQNFFSCGTEIYKGYVDDPRNTDNAWMETVAVNFHDESGKHTSTMNLIAGDDASKAKWISIDSTLNLYASHLSFLIRVVRLRDCHW